MKAKSLYRVALVVGLLFGVCEARGQTTQDKIELANVTLTLGMPRDVAIRKLAERNKVLEFPNLIKGREVWWVYSQSGDNQIHSWGNVDFSNGKLVGVKRNWGSQDGSKGVQIARALHSVIVGTLGTKSNLCEVSAGRSHLPEVDTRLVRIYCGEKKIEVSISRHNPSGKETANVYEIFGD